jgi:hypothetical protein
VERARKERRHDVQGKADAHAAMSYSAAIAG